MRCTLALRAAGCTEPDQWLKFVDEDIVLVHPITPYRSFRPGDVVSHRCAGGVEEGVKGGVGWVWGLVWL